MIQTERKIEDIVSPEGEVIGFKTSMGGCDYPNDDGIKKAISDLQRLNNQTILQPGTPENIRNGEGY